MERSESPDEFGEGRDPVNPSSPSPAGGGIYCPYTVRNSFVAIIAVTTAMPLWLITSFWFDACIQRREAERFLKSAELGARLDVVLAILNRSLPATESRQEMGAMA